MGDLDLSDVQVGFGCMKCGTVSYKPKEGEAENYNAWIARLETEGWQMIRFRDGRSTGACPACAWPARAR